MYKKIALLAVALIAAVALVGVFNASAQDEMTYTVSLGGNEALGDFLVDSEGMTLYIFTNDEPGVSNCSGQCIENWPALTVAEGEWPTLAPEVSGRLGVITRDDGARQVTYNGWPLYYWVNDSAPGDATGHEVGGVWYVAITPDVGLGGNADLGDFLVGPEGYTLYIFTNDTEGVSNCSGQCLENWPALTVDSADSVFTELGLVGEFATITRDDGSFQVTLNGLPLYYWINDAVPGDATGHEVGGVWFVAKLPTLAAVENEAFESILVGANGMSLYTFANDAAGVSNCAGQCAVNWPPLTVAEGETPVIEGAEGTVGVIAREDGTFQVTYNDAPLYYWVGDVIPGDTTGHNVGDVWFVALP